MIITIDLTSLSYHMTGIERYASCMTEEMLNLDNINNYILIFRNNICEPFNKYIDNKRVKAIIITGDNKLLFYQKVLYKTLDTIKSDKYIFFAFTSPVFFKRKGIINTIHDMGAWDCSYTMKKLQNIYFRFTTRASAGHSDEIITVSEFSKQRINKILKFPLSRIHVIPSAVTEKLKTSNEISYEDIKKKYGLPEKYILSLSTLEPRKNLPLLLNSYSSIAEKVGYDLLLVGRKGWKMDEVLSSLKNSSRVVTTGFVEDDEVAEIYKHALCFVFPSLYEGFGLPPVEALSLGVPVISSDAASLPEVLQNQAVYFRNHDGEQLSNLLLTIETKVGSMPHGLSIEQEKEYSFKTSATKLLRIIDQESR